MTAKTIIGKEDLNGGRSRPRRRRERIDGMVLPPPCRRCQRRGTNGDDLPRHGCRPAAADIPVVTNTEEDPFPSITIGD